MTKRPVVADRAWTRIEQECIGLATPDLAPHEDIIPFEINLVSLDVVGNLKDRIGVVELAPHEVVTAHDVRSGT